MIRVKLSFPHWPIERQTPNGIGVWGNCLFLCNNDVEECDYWVVCEGLERKKEKTRCPSQNTILVTCEPPSIKSYKQEFLDQFATIITCHHNLHHPNVVLTHPALPWHVGRRQKNHVNIEFSKDYDELSTLTDFNKTKLISVITSAKDDTEGHRLRLSFVEALKSHFGDTVDIFGRGIREVEDKWDALAPYRYHIALENSRTAHYWTEKLSDPFLAGCHPFYYGCPNIHQYFPEGALTVIDINSPQTAMKVIENALGQDRYGCSKPLLDTARDLLLNRYNLFAVIHDYVNSINRETGKQKYPLITLKKEPSDSNVLYQMKQGLNKFLRVFP